MILQVHDELVFEVPGGRSAAAVEPLVREAMEGAAQLRVPLKVRLGFGPELGRREIGRDRPGLGKSGT